MDTIYKRKLLEIMTQNYRYQNVKKTGELEIVVNSKTTVVCDLVLMSEWKTVVPGKNIP